MYVCIVHVIVPIIYNNIIVLHTSIVTDRNISKQGISRGCRFAQSYTKVDAVLSSSRSGAVFGVVTKLATILAVYHAQLR